MRVRCWEKFGATGYTDSLGLRMTHWADFDSGVHIRGVEVILGRSSAGELFIVSSDANVSVERAVGHRGPFPTEEAALTYLQLVKD